VVERAGGQFVHHDGGLEDGESRLWRALGSADVVICPVDCVSHNACLLAKQFISARSCRCAAPGSPPSWRACATFRAWSARPARESVPRRPIAAHLIGATKALQSGPANEDLQDRSAS